MTTLEELRAIGHAIGQKFIQAAWRFREPPTIPWPERAAVISACFPVREDRVVDFWDSVMVHTPSGLVVFVHSIEDFNRRLGWASRPLPKEYPSAPPALAIPG